MIHRLIIALTTAIFFSSTTHALEQDKIKHAALSSGIGSVAQGGLEEPYQALSVCIGVGIGKELYDEIDYGGFSEQDLVADIISCAFGVGTAKYLGFSLGIRQKHDSTMITVSVPFN